LVSCIILSHLASCRQADGILELNHLIDAGLMRYTSGDAKMILGREPLSVQAWAESVKECLAPKQE